MFVAFQALSATCFSGFTSWVSPAILFWLMSVVPPVLCATKYNVGSSVCILYLIHADPRLLSSLHALQLRLWYVILTDFLYYIPSMCVPVCCFPLLFTSVSNVRHRIASWHLVPLLPPPLCCDCTHHKVWPMLLIKRFSLCFCSA